jgi:chloramphenicol-sensitive protein RarD
VTEPRRSPRTGVVFAFAAYGLWGFLPLYFIILAPANAFEIVAWRIVCSLVFCAILLTVTRSWPAFLAIVRSRRLLLAMALAAVFIYVNWQVYVFGATTGHVVETSLGYFINPLVSVLLGVVVFSERLRTLQWTAVGIAAVAVAVLTVDYGRPPWIALTLALTFGLYGLMKKLVRTEAAPGLFVETALVALPAVAVLAVAHSSGTGTFGSAGTGHALLLVSSGVATAVPLLLFAAAARRIPLSTVGLLQYLTPSMQLAIGVFVYDEPMPPVRLAGFAIVWVALAVFTADTLRHARAGNRRAASETVPAGL